MRRMLFILSMIFPMTSLLAQTISRQNCYRANDQLAGRQIICPQFTATGSGLVWDISQREETSDEDYIVEYTPADGTALTAVSEQDTRYLYKMQGDSLLISGFENHTTLMDYDLPEEYLHFTMHFGDSIEGYFHGTGKYCDRLGMRHYGRYKTKADGVGYLVFAEGDTLRNVLRLHTERTMAVETMPIELLDSLNAYSQDSIDQHIANDSALIRMDICRWYADGYRYPVLETRVRRDSSGEHVLAESAYYYPPSALATISNDPENEMVRASSRAERGRNQTVGDIAEQETGRPIGEPDIRIDDLSGRSGTNFNLYSVDGRRISKRQATRNGVYLHEERQADIQSTSKTIIKK